MKINISPYSSINNVSPETSALIAVKHTELENEAKFAMNLQKQIDNLILSTKIQEALDLIEHSNGKISGSNYYLVFKVIHLDKLDFLPILNEKNVFDDSFPRDKFFEYLLKHKAKNCASWLFENNLFFSPSYLKTIKITKSAPLRLEVKDILRKGIVALIQNDMHPVSIDIFSNFIIHTCQTHSPMLINKIRTHIAKDLNLLERGASDYGLAKSKIDNFQKSYSKIFEVVFDKYALEHSIQLPTTKDKSPNFKI